MARSAYKNAAMKAPTPTTDPATARIVAAAPVDAAPVAVPVAVVISFPSVPVAVGVTTPSLPVIPATPLGVGVATGANEVLPLTFWEKTIRVVELVPVPANQVWRPGPRSGIVAATPTEVAASGWVSAWEGCEGWDVATAGMPVTTPRELVWVRKVVCGWASMEDES